MIPPADRTNRSRIIFGAKNETAGFSNLGRDLSKIVVAMFCGIGFSFLFAWDSEPDTVDITVQEIFLHNMSLAILALFLTHYGAIAMVVLNGFWLGISLVASAAIVGTQQTLGLTIVHVPLEIVAWALTVEGARIFMPTVVGALRKRHAWVHARAKMRKALTAPVLFYALAALAEWAEHTLLER